MFVEFTASKFTLDALILAENWAPLLFPKSVVHVSVRIAEEVVYKTTMLPALKFCVSDRTYLTNILLYILFEIEISDVVALFIAFTVAKESIK